MDLGTLGAEGFEVEEWLGQQDSTDFFAFEVSEAMKVGIVIDGHSDDIDLYVFDSTGHDTLASSQAGGTSIEDAILDLQPGRYLVSADFYRANQSDYRLSIFSIEQSVN